MYLWYSLGTRLRYRDGTLPVRSECSTSCRVVFVRFFFGVLASLAGLVSPALSVAAAGAGVAAGAGLAAGAGWAGASAAGALCAKAAPALTLSANTLATATRDNLIISTTLPTKDD